MNVHGLPLTIHLFKMQKNKIYQGDCLEVLKTFEAESVDCCVTSPPYDAARNYGNTLVWNFDIFKGIASQLFRVLKKGSVLIWVVGDSTKNGSESGTSFTQALYFKEIGFNLHDTMIYRKKNYTPLTHNRYEQEWEYMFVLSKGKPKTFNPIKIPSTYAGQKTWGKPKLYKTNSDTLTQVESYVCADTKIKGNIFEYATGSTTSSAKFNHPAMFPEQLAHDHIISWSNEGDTILDPFMGSGTTAVVAERLGRDWIGIELNESYIKIAEDRIFNEWVKTYL